MSRGNAHDADLTAIIGATGSGKTLLVKARLEPAAPPRMIWSPKEPFDRYAPQFGELIEGNPRRLVARVEAGAHVVYVPPRHDDALLLEHFGLFCQLAHAVGARRVLVEEMSLVATSRSSPPWWKTLVTEGRARGLSLVATTQRPQFCDAALLDAATEIYCGRLQRGSSHKLMADVMGGLPLEQVRGLAPLEFLRWRVGVAGVEPVAALVPARRARSQRKTL